MVTITSVHYYLAELLKVSQKPPLKLLVPYSESSIKLDIVLDQYAALRLPVDVQDVVRAVTVQRGDLASFR